MDPTEIAKFTYQPDEWWNCNGPFKALHEINPVRTAYVESRIALADKQVLDVGCGGGLLAESLAVKGAQVTGIDMAASALATANDHMVQTGVDINYQLSTAEAWSRHHPAAYDAVVCMELIEHVPMPQELVKSCSRLVRSGGSVFFATVNRTWTALALVIWFSEYLLGIVAKGTHQYRKFVRPTELASWGQAADLTLADTTGLRYVPFIGYARLCKSVRMNYIMHFIRQTVGN